MEEQTCQSRGIALVPTDVVLKEAFDDFIEAYSILCTRRRITASAAKTTHKRTATTSVNSTILMALLKAIKLEVMKCFSSTHTYFIWVTQSYFFYQRHRSIVHGGERDTLSEAAVSSRTVVTFVIWLIFRTELLV